MNWTAIITAGLSSLFGSLLAIVATPWLQHHFWKRQRRAELRLKTIDDTMTLTSQFIAQWMDAGFRNERYKPALDWHEKIDATDGRVKALFSNGTYQVFKELERRIDPDLGAAPGSHGSQASIHDFHEARDAAAKAMYKEVV